MTSAPMVGTFGCCPCAASGHAAAALPSSVMTAVPAYRRLSMPWKHPQVLGLDLKCSEIAA
jgi:hypothetical protein